MGTNYYLVKDDEICESCGHNSGGDELHIGKSSAGWCFALHVIPELGINDLDDWVRLFERKDAKIRDECGMEIEPICMTGIITGRAGRHPIVGYDYASNHAEPSEFNLIRCKVDGSNCVGHGSGTWDLIAGEFS